MAGAHVNLRLVVSMVAAQGIDLSVEHHRADVSARIGQIAAASVLGSADGRIDPGVVLAASELKP